MQSPGLEAPHPQENPFNLPIYRPMGLTHRFPPGWDIKVLVEDGNWSAAKDTRYLMAPTEGALHALVMESERRRAQATKR